MTLWELTNDMYESDTQMILRKRIFLSTNFNTPRLIMAVSNSISCLK